MESRLSFAALAFAAAALSLQSAPAVGADRIVAAHEGKVEYANGGIGKDERDAMARTAGRYNLRLVFSEHQDNEMVAGAQLRVLDASGKQVFSLADTGAVTELRLPPGRYDVIASLAGRTEKQGVELGKGEHKELAFHWQRGG